MGVMAESTAVEFGVLYMMKIIQDNSICDLEIVIQFK